MNYRSLLIVCLATLGLAVAGWGQADDKIAFTSLREGYFDVWIMNADGSDPVNLTKGRHCASPAWSPDGTKIAYIGDIFKDTGEVQFGGEIGLMDAIHLAAYLSIAQEVQFGGEIWLMDADGGNPQQLTDDSVHKTSLWWSEDGRSIYYTVPDRDDRWVSYDVFVMTLDGSDSSPVDWREPRLDQVFTRSPDGTKLANVVLADEEGNAHLYVRDVSEYQRSYLSQIQVDLWGTPLPDLPQQGKSEYGIITTSDLAWSPDSMRIAFEAFTGPIGDDRHSEIWAVDIDGSNLVNLTNGLGGFSPAWQPVVPSATATSVESQSWGRIKSLLSH